MANPKITILISAYNGEKHLNESINSNLDQTLKVFKFIIRHKDTSYLCKTDAQNIADVIKAVLSDSSLRKKMGENARYFVVENNSLEQTLKMELDVIREVITA